jgi:hypothetical protein
MISHKDIYLSAQVLIKKHGDKAEEIASLKMEAMMKRDDAKGAGVWLAIISAIDDLRSVKTQEKLH